MIVVDNKWSRPIPRAVGSKNKISIPRSPQSPQLRLIGASLNCYIIQSSYFSLSRNRDDGPCFQASINAPISDVAVRVPGGGLSDDGADPCLETGEGRTGRSGPSGSGSYRRGTRRRPTASIGNGFVSPAEDASPSGDCTARLGTPRRDSTGCVRRPAQRDGVPERGSTRGSELLADGRRGIASIDDSPANQEAAFPFFVPSQTSSLRDAFGPMVCL